MKKIYIVKEAIFNRFENMIFEDGRYPHHHMFAERLKPYLKKLDVEVFETTLSDLPNDGLIVVYSRPGIEQELSIYQPFFLRRVFLVDLFAPIILSPKQFWGYSFAGLFRSP